MNQKYIITIGYKSLAFNDAETAMRAYALLTESTPCEHFSTYGAEYKRPEQFENVSYVREAGDTEIELKRVDVSKFALHLTDKELREKCRVQPTEVEGEAHLVEEAPAVVAISGPSNDEPTDVTDIEPFI